MANNFKYSGKRITIQNIGAAVEPGAICRRAGYVGIPMVRGVVGQSVSFALEGVWGLTYSAYAGLGAVTLAAGSILYWDVANAVLSMGRGVNDYAAVKCVTAVSTVDGSFDGLLLHQGAPKTADQS